MRKIYAAIAVALIASASARAIDLNDHLHAKRQVRRFRVRRGVTSEESKSYQEKKPFSVGPTIQGGVHFGRVQSNEGFTANPQYAVGLQTGYRFSNQFMVEVAGLYEMLSFSRTLDGSGPVSDPNPIGYSQKNTYAGLKVDFSYCVDDAWGGDGEFLWWLSGGAEYLFGLSGKQTNTLGEELDLKPKGLVFLYAGTTGTYLLSEATQINGKLQAFWHVTAQNSTLFGLRLAVALQFSLL